MGKILSDAEMTDILHPLVVEGKPIEYEDFVTAVSDKEAKNNTELLRKAFDLIDKEKTNTLETTEVKSILSLFSVTLAEQKTNKEKCEKVIEKLNEALIDFDEFCFLVKEHTEEEEEYE